MEYRPIDWDQCIELMNGQEALAKKLLELFMQHLPESWQNIQLAHQEENHQRLAEQIHKLYGACCYCAMPGLTQILIRLREAVKEKQLDALPDLHHALDEEIHAVQREYERLVTEGVLK